jgi:hypothetical protein
MMEMVDWSWEGEEANEFEELASQLAKIMGDVISHQSEE